MKRYKLHVIIISAIMTILALGAITITYGADNTTIEFEKKSITVNYDTTTYLDLTSNTEGLDTSDFKWKSSKPEVAKVTKDGALIALKKGTTTITATTKGGYSTKCKVTVDDFTYLAINDFKTIQAYYPQATPNIVGTYAYTNAYGYDVVMTYVNFRIINDHEQFTMHLGGRKIEDISGYYKNEMRKRTGDSYLRASQAYSEAMEAQTRILNGEGCYSGTATAAGTKHKVSGSTYKILSESNKTVALTKAKNIKKVKITDKVKIKGKYYSVTQINAKAFTGSKIRQVDIGARVKTIQKNAFQKSKATNLIVRTKLLKAARVKGSLKGSKISKIVVKVGTKAENKAYVKTYKIIFKKANSGTNRKVKVQ